MFTTSSFRSLSKMEQTRPLRRAMLMATQETNFVKKKISYRSYPESNRGRRNAPDMIRIRSANPYTIKPVTELLDD